MYEPAFTAESAQQYFQKTYRDEKRNHTYVPLPEFERPLLPEHIFSLRYPTESELNRSIKRKRNGAAPGMNGLTYVPYKKCTAIMQFVLKLSTKIWKSRDIPTDWAIVYIKLLSKSDDLSVVSEFRPIAITCVAGKIFFLFSQTNFKLLCCEAIKYPKNVQKVFFSWDAWMH